MLHHADDDEVWIDVVSNSPPWRGELTPRRGMFGAATDLMAKSMHFCNSRRRIDNRGIRTTVVKKPTGKYWPSIVTVSRSCTVSKI